MLCVIGWPYPTDGSEHVAWIQRFWPALEPFARGFYVNDSEPEMANQVVNENYRGNYERLVRVKNRYDPINLFRLNANVEPRP
jgi:FAD/FMN-containing dehydrogenase